MDLEQHRKCQETESEPSSFGHEVIEIGASETKTEETDTCETDTSEIDLDATDMDENVMAESQSSVDPGAFQLVLAINGRAWLLSAEPIDADGPQHEQHDRQNLADQRIVSAVIPAKVQTGAGSTLPVKPSNKEKLPSMEMILRMGLKGIKIAFFLPETKMGKHGWLPEDESTTPLIQARFGCIATVKVRNESEQGILVVYWLDSFQGEQVGVKHMESQLRIHIDVNKSNLPIGYLETAGKWNEHRINFYGVSKIKQLPTDVDDETDIVSDGFIKAGFVKECIFVIRYIPANGPLTVSEIKSLRNELRQHPSYDKIPQAVLDCTLQY